MNDYKDIDDRVFESYLRDFTSIEQNYFYSSSNDILTNFKHINIKIDKHLSNYFFIIKISLTINSGYFGMIKIILTAIN